MLYLLCYNALLCLIKENEFMQRRTVGQAEILMHNIQYIILYLSSYYAFLILIIVIEFII